MQGCHDCYTFEFSLEKTCDVIGSVHPVRKCSKRSKADQSQSRFGMVQVNRNLVLVRSLRSSFIDSSSSVKKRCNTLQGFGAFFGQSCDRDRFLFPSFYFGVSLSLFLFFDFITISGCVFNNKKNYSTRA